MGGGNSREELKSQRANDCVYMWSIVVYRWLKNWLAAFLLSHARGRVEFPQQINFQKLSAHSNKTSMINREWNNVNTGKFPKAKATDVSPSAGKSENHKTNYYL